MVDIQDTILRFLPLLIPLLVVQLGLLVFALVDLLKPERVTRGPKWVWVLVIVLVNLIGPIVYFAAGREE
jgi:hypothetical protein